MKNLLLTLSFLCFILVNLSAQEDKYKAIQGLGYLHTQTIMLVKHWKTHPLNHKPIDDHEKELQEHIINQMEHDEEWAEYMMVEDNLNHFADHIDDKTKKAIQFNMKFYHEAIQLMKDPDKMDREIDRLRKGLVKLDDNLYHIIYPSLCK